MEKWEDVTEQCTVNKRGNGIEYNGKNIKGYRFRKMLISDLLEHEDQQYTKYVFIVERKKP